MMEGEINTFMVVWSTVLACLCYCHTIDKLLPKPTIIRALSIIPVSCLFILLPLNLNSINLGATSSFFIAWLASFKVVLFAFGNGPLSSSPPLALSSFILLACLPIKLQTPLSSQSKKTQRSSANHFAKFMLLVMLFCVYKYQEYIHPNLILLCYGLHIYFVLELMLVAVTAAAKAAAGIELEPPFDEPFMATSLQDFWGRRWNLMVTNILRPTVYDPVRRVSGRVLPAVVATFLVSGIMHELVFYNIGRVKPSGEVLCFFLLHGACLAVEIGIKKSLNGRFRLPGFVSGTLALSFVIVTSFWLFFPPLLKNKADVKACSEFLAFIESVKHHSLVSPNNITCPFF